MAHHINGNPAESEAQRVGGIKSDLKLKVI